MAGPRFTDLALSLPASVPFVGPEAQERARGRRFKARIGANENLFGPSPKAVEAMADAASGAWMYGDPESHELRNALAQHHQVAAPHIMIGEGIDALLGYLVRLIIGSGDKVVTSEGAYPTFNYHVAGYGGDLTKVPYDPNDRENLSALISKAREVEAKMIYFANPDNPMGTWYEGSDIEALLDDIPEDCLLVLDEAYIETAPASAVPAISPQDPRVVRMRTFSKAYGLAGARVGYAIGAVDLIDAFNKVRNHFAMNRVSQAGALAALSDQKYLSETIAKITESRDEIARIAQSVGLRDIPSATNFVAIDCGRDGAFASRVLHELINRDVFVRMPFVAPQDRCIRISAGRAEDLAIFAAALPDALKDAQRE